MQAKQKTPDGKVQAALLDRANELGRGLSELSRGAGKNHAYLHQFIWRGTPRNLPEKVRKYLSSELNLAESVLGGASDAIYAYKKAPANAASPENISSHASDLPILGSGVGGDEEWGIFVDNGDVYGYTRRPGNLVGVGGAYAIYVVGKSMTPRYEHGEMLHVNPFKPVNPGDLCGCTTRARGRARRPHIPRQKIFTKKPEEPLP